MGNKTLYIRDSDEEIWQKAESLVNELDIESLSKLVTDALNKEVIKLETLKELKGDVGKIIVQIESEMGTKKVAFNGKWLVRDYVYYKHLISVALTEKESYFVLYDGQGECDDDYEIYEYFHELLDSADLPEELKSMVANEIGEDYVEFLDI